MIVGNKVDKEFGRVVSTEEGEAFAKSRNPPWLFVSGGTLRSFSEGSADYLTS